MSSEPGDDKDPPESQEGTGEEVEKEDEEEAADVANEDDQDGNNDEEEEDQDDGDDNDDDGAADDDDNDDDNNNTGDEEGGSNSDGSGDSDSSSSDDDEAAAAGPALSLEDRRMMRIKRNQERLTSLGLGNKKVQAKPKQQRKKEKVEIDPNDIRKSSRSSKKAIDYAALTPKWAPSGDGKASGTPKKSRSRKSEKPKAGRLERFIYLEFRRIKSERRDNLKNGEKQFKHATNELKHATKRDAAVSKKPKKKQEYEQKGANLEAERAKYGAPLKEIMQDTDRRHAELNWAIQQSGSTQVSAQRLQQIENERLEQERKMEMIDAMNRFPIALKDAVQDLNYLLVERAPRDPPPPRRGNRKRQAEDEPLPTKKKARIEVASPGSDAGGPSKDKGGWQNLAAAIAAEPSKMSQTAIEDAKSSKGPTKGRKKTRNIGGWVDPNFSKEIRRSWLQIDKYESSFDLSRYSPQIGDIVLYYPAGHRAFLKRHPDVLGKKMRNKNRMPLWERAQKERGKLAKDEGEKDKESEAAPIVNSAAKQSDWWNDEWLAGVEGKLGNYPLICRVERTHAEFPPDPYAESETVTEDGVQKVVFKVPPSGNKKRKVSSPSLCLALVLKPITPLLPPGLDGEATPLSLPPAFHVVSFPSKCAPFLVPFGVGYQTAHSLTVEEKVKWASQSQRRGIIKSFSSVGEKYGSCRLDDKLRSVSELLSFLQGEGSMSLATALGSSLTLDSKQKALTLPLAEAGIVFEKLATALGTAKPPAAVNSSWRVDGKLIALIRGTLPLWKGVSVLGDDRKMNTVSSWELHVPKGDTKSQLGGLYSNLTSHVLADNGLMYHVDEALRAKIEFALEDFTEKNEDTHAFWDPVTDDIAPSYSCAVPLGICFQKILRRLSCRKAANTIGHCYYRSLDSLLCDVGTILDNAMLYNSPDAEIVDQAFRVIPQAKTLIEQVANRHQKEREVREKADEERKKKIMLQYNVAACVQSTPSTVSEALETKATKSRRSSISKEVQASQGPFLEPLERDWIEQSRPDASWRPMTDAPAAATAHSDTDKTSHNEWIPQSGDFVLYSRELHAEFIKGHHESLLTDQCSLPQFVLHAKEDGLAEDTAIVTDQRAVGKTIIGQVPTVTNHDEKDTKQPALSGDSVDMETFYDRLPRSQIPKKSPLADAEDTTPAVEGESSIHPDSPPAPEVRVHDTPHGTDGSSRTEHPGVPPILVKVRVDGKLTGNDLTASLANKLSKTSAPTVEIDSASRPSGDKETSMNNQESKLTSTQDDALERTSGHEGNEKSNDEGPHGGLHSHWLVARIVWVRRVFPRIPSKKNEAKDTFNSRSPLLSIGLCFDYEWSRGEQIHTMHWRPCHLPELASKSRCEAEHCPACGCQASFGFLLPAWLYRSTQQEWFSSRRVLFPREVTLESELHFGQPIGLKRDSVAAINRCLNLLKRRCISRVPPDFVDEKLTIANVKKGWNPPSRMGNKGVPTFEHILAGDGSMDTERSSNRQLAQNRKWGNKEEQAESIPPLSEIHFLPPFSKVPVALPSAKNIRSTSKAPKAVTKELPFESTMCPSPKLCLELVQQRLRSGYYRQKNALIDDIQEAYVSSVLLVLSKQASQKFAKLSVRKVARSLNTRGATKNPFAKKSKKQEAAPEDDAKKKADDAKSQQKNEEEALWIEKVQQIRSLYAMALVSVSDTPYLERIFGISPKKVAAPKTTKEPSAKEQCIKDARQKGFLLLSAFSRDPSTNRGKRKALRTATVYGNQDGDVYPTVQVKISVSGSLAGEQLEPILFEPSQYGPTEKLHRCFFGKPGRMQACGRCQVYRRSILACRVQRGHSNADFDWDIMTNTGGVNGLLFSMKTGELLPSIQNGPEEASKATPKEPDTETTSVAVVDTAAQATAAALEKQKLKEEALAQVENAKKALSLAQSLLEDAKKEAVSQLLLSDDFIRTAFPTDPVDGHYNYCTICGLSGDVICCEKCPNVMHPKCTGMESIPEGDWFCSKCTGKENTKATEELTDLGRSQVVNAVAGPSEETATQTNPIENPDTPATDHTAPAFDREAMEAELGKLLHNLRNYRHSYNPPKYKKKSEQEVIAIDAKNEESKMDSASGVAQAKSASADTGEDAESNKENDEGGSPSRGRARRQPDRFMNATSTEAEEEEPTEAEGDDRTLPIGIGSKVSKAFGKRGHFMGVVKGLPSYDYPFYEIRYEDGDLEDLDEKELRKVMIFRKAPGKRSRQGGDDGGNPPKKKVRHSSGGRKGVARVYEDPMDALSPQARAFLATIKISDAGAFLKTQTSLIADTLPAWRKKEKMPVLKGSGTIATVSGWKGLVRKAAAESGKLELACTEVKWGHRKSEGGGRSGSSPGKRRKSTGSQKAPSVLESMSPRGTASRPRRGQRQSIDSTAPTRGGVSRRTSRSRSSTSQDDRKPAGRRSSRGRRSDSPPESSSDNDESESDEEEPKQSSRQSRAKRRSDSPPVTASSSRTSRRSRTPAKVEQSPKESGRRSSSRPSRSAARTSENNTASAATTPTTKRRRTRRSFS